MYDVKNQDCLDWLPIFRGAAQLVYIDPPYNTGKDFYHQDGSFAYSDKWDSDAEYVGYLRDRLLWCWNALADDGSLWVHSDWHCDYLIRWTLNQVCGSKAYRNQIAWCYTGPGPGASHFPRKHDTIFFYSKPDAPFYQPKVPHSPYSAELRASKTEGDLMPFKDLSPDGKALEDYWTDIKTDLRANILKHGYPTEKPIALLNRIITCSSEEGRLVLDPMAGSGVALEAAKRLNRQYAGCDFNSQAVEMAQARLDAIPAVQPSLESET